MNTQATAEIIPFPNTRQNAATHDAAAQAHDELQQRLARAMQSLQASLEEQRRAVAEWRGSMEQLKTVTASIGQGLSTYRNSLETLDGQVVALRDQAVQLEQWADGQA